MRKRIRERYEDKRLDWRDPDMPVLRRIRTDDGKVIVVPISPLEEQHFHSNKLANTDGYLDGWKHDPLYNARRKRYLR